MEAINVLFPGATTPLKLISIVFAVLIAKKQ